MTTTTSTTTTTTTATTATATTTTTTTATGTSTTGLLRPVQLFDPNYVFVDPSLLGFSVALLQKYWLFIFDLVLLIFLVFVV